jgi:23S rRNA pseudouridine2605 synthase
MPSSGQESPEASGLVRLNKALAQAGVCSRRAADALIRDGEVRINDLVVRTPGIRIDPQKDRVHIKGEPVRLFRPGVADHLYLALHKPKGVMSTAKDPQGRLTVLDLLPPDIRRQRPFPVGRLDRMSEGLLLLTTDGELALRLTHPRHEHPKVYHVLVRGRVPPEKLQAMRSGMILAEGDRLAPVLVRELSRTAGGILLEMVLRQGVNRQIRRMCRDLRLHVLRLVRVQQGPIRLVNLAPGAWRRLRPEEMEIKA